MSLSFSLLFQTLSERRDGLVVKRTDEDKQPGEAAAEGNIAGNPRAKLSNMLGCRGSSQRSGAIVL